MEAKRLNSELLRADIDRSLGRPISDDFWKLLWDDARITPVLEGEESASGLISYIRQLVKATTGVALGQKAPRMARKQEPKVSHEDDESIAELRDSVVSLLLEEEANREEPKVREFREFREEILQGRLVEPEMLERWMRDRAYEDNERYQWGKPHPFTGFLSSRTIPRLKPRGRGTWYRMHPDWGMGTDRPSLPFIVPDADYLIWVFAVPGGVVEYLGNLAEYLTEMYPWELSQAVTYVVTGGEPVIQRVAGHVYRRPVKAGVRIELFVDPVVTPLELAEYYKGIRDHITEGKRPRALTEKHLLLAAFDDSGEEEESWDVIMRRWNNLHPAKDFSGYQYTNRRNFQRDMVEARRRLLSPEYDDGLIP